MNRPERQKRAMSEKTAARKADEGVCPRLEKAPRQRTRCRDNPCRGTRTERPHIRAPEPEGLASDHVPEHPVPL